MSEHQLLSLKGLRKDIERLALTYDNVRAVWPDGRQLVIYLDDKSIISVTSLFIKVAGTDDQYKTTENVV